jgi:5-methylcytosine-specific restriction endonuclease McrA
MEMSEGWEGVSARQWQRVRLTVLDRDGWKCQIKTPGVWRTMKGEERRCMINADCVHHTLGIQKTGMDTRYLVAACTPCNLKVGDPTKRPDPPLEKRTKW